MQTIGQQKSLYESIETCVEHASKIFDTFESESHSEISAWDSQVRASTLSGQSFELNSLNNGVILAFAIVHIAITLQTR